jgi:hypothetical protein
MRIIEYERTDDAFLRSAPVRTRMVLEFGEDESDSESFLDRILPFVPSVFPGYYRTSIVVTLTSKVGEDGSRRKCLECCYEDLCRADLFEDGDTPFFVEAKK